MEKQELIDRLMGGEVFRGRKALLRELSLIFSNFGKEVKKSLTK
ncbi:Competence-specific sigma factor ComX [Streptococcus oralis]|uniref:Competence-specific sigma factor ComX n=1 Tax=Streptococcus oralis TaxID=1303 RepID=A0A139RH07_STROR|nr:Competence-specific sigma factor ComX [Streptococcus oralis]